MGAYLFYVNYDLEEYFSIGTGGFNTKLSALGYVPAARAMGLLLANPAATTDVYQNRFRSESIVGRWHKTRVAVEADDFGDGWNPEDTDFVDVSADIIVMLCMWDGIYLESLLAEHEEFWLHVAHLAVSSQLPDHIRAVIEPLLGPSYQQRFADKAAAKSFEPAFARLPETMQWF